MFLPSKSLAQQIIHNLAQHGTPLSHGVSYYTSATSRSSTPSKNTI